MKDIALNEAPHSQVKQLSQGQARALGNWVEQ
jgi:hypothetical protein